MRSHLLYKLLIWIILIVSLLLLIRLAPNLYKPEGILVDDFGHFWASGKLFLSHDNPYDLEHLITIQEQTAAVHSPKAGIVSQTLNPPWTLLLFSPFSILDYNLARVVWLFINIILLVISIRIFWGILPGSKNKLGLALLVSFCFAPTYSVLSKGQITPWVVLGIAGLLLYTEGRLNVLWAGACLVLISVKPQLFYLIWPAMGFWIIKQRRWNLVVTGMISLILAIFITILINPQVFVHYLSAIQEYPYDQWATPTIGSYLRFFWLGEDKILVQYLPAMCGFCWLIFYYHKNKHKWSWREKLPLLSLISLITTPYSWTYDQVLLLPAILRATQRLTRKFTFLVALLWLIFVIINLLDLIMHMKLSEFWFLWLAPAFFLWYVVSISPRVTGNSCESSH